MNQRELNNKPHKFDNPWADSEKFISLGTYYIWTLDGQKKHYDLYALADLNKTNTLWDVQLGARYSNEGGDYISGYLDFGWEYNSNKPIHTAAMRFTQWLLNNK